MRVRAALRCFDAGAGGGADEWPQCDGVFCGFLARRHEDRVGLCRLPRESLGYVAIALAVLLRACDRGGAFDLAAAETCVRWGWRPADASMLLPVAEQRSASSGKVYSVGFSPGGSRIVSGSEDGSVRVWGAQRSLSLLARGGGGRWGGGIS